MVDDKPACSAAVLMVDGYRYVALVATDPALQRPGYALEAAAAAHGDLPTTLHAHRPRAPSLQGMG